MNQELVDTYGELASEISQATGLHPSVVLGIIDTESSGGKRMHGNNLFGISPVVNGRQVVAGYPDIGAAAQAFTDLMQTKRYANIGKLTDPAEQAKALVAAGYNTVDKSYAQKIADRAGQAIKLGVAPPASAGAGGTGGKSQKDLAIESIGGDEENPPAPSPAGSKQTAGSTSQRDAAVQEVTQSLPVPQPPSPFKYGAQGGAEDFGIPGPKIPEGAPGVPLPPPPTASQSVLDYLKGAGTRMLEAGKQGYQAGIIGPEGENWLGSSPGASALRYLSKDIGAGLHGAGQLYNELVQRPLEAGAEKVAPGSGRDVVGLTDTALMLLGLKPGYGPGGLTRTLEDIRAAPGVIVDATKNALTKPILSQEFKAAPVAPGAEVRATTEGARRAAEGVVPEASRVDDAALQAAAAAQSDAQRSAGAAGTPYGQITKKTDAQRLADVQKSVKETAEDRAGPAMRDDTAYFEGIPTRLLAERSFNPTVARDEKFARMKYDAFSKEALENDSQRHQGMRDYVNKEAGDANTMKQMADDRAAAAPPNETFVGEKPTSQGQRVVDRIDELLAGEEGQRDKVRPILEKIRARFVDSEGNAETLPSRLRGARQNAADYLRIAFGAGDEAQAAKLVQHIITGDILPLADAAISDGAPKYANWLKTWYQKSLPIDQAEFFQKYSTGTKKIWDDNGYLNPHKVQVMLEDVEAGLRARGPNNVKSLTDEQIDKIIAMRNETATTRLKKKYEDIPGSPTFHLIDRAAEQGEGVFGQMGNALTQLGTYLGTGSPEINAGLAAVQATLAPFVKMRKEAVRAKKAEGEKEARRRNLLTRGPEYGTMDY